MFEKNKKSNFIKKIPTVGADLQHVGGRMDGEQTPVAFRSFAKAPNIQNRIIRTAYNSNLLQELSCLDCFLSTTIIRLLILKHRLVITDKFYEIKNLTKYFMQTPYMLKLLLATTGELKFLNLMFF